MGWQVHGPHRRVLVRPKYLRKLAATKMFWPRTPGGVVDFIQGGPPRTLLARHYPDLLPRAVEHYERYAGWLREFLRPVVGK